MKTILVVDDNLDAGRPLAILLSNAQRRGLHLTSGEEALSFLQTDVPDLLILDVMMPDIDGMEILRKLRADPRTAGVPVVMYTALSDPALKTHALKQGANDYWVKTSLDVNELRNRVDSLLSLAT